MPHRNIATPSAPVRGLYSQALEERGHIPVKPAPASSQTQRMALFGFAREGRVLSINGLQNESGLQFLGVTTNLASSRQYFCFATLCDDCATSLSFTIKGKVLMKISELRFHKKIDQISFSIPNYHFTVKSLLYEKKHEGAVVQKISYIRTDPLRYIETKLFVCKAFKLEPNYLVFFSGYS